MSTPRFTMKLDMRVLEHLGIKLYSNVAAVLSELVANSWDADATEVGINFNLDNDEIVIRDDGVGMSAADINARFLHVGYNKRGAEGAVSPVFERQFMGRKGIGKLSVFSVAKRVAVYSSNGSEKNSIQIDLSLLEKAVESGAEYHPEEITYNADFAPEYTGTTLVLTGLIKKRVKLSIAALRKRIARRFSVVGSFYSVDHQFDVKINGEPIGIEDRDDLRALEYLWEFGSAYDIPSDKLKKLDEKFLVTPSHIPGHPEWEVQGWFGTAYKPGDLESEEGGSLRNIVVMARGRLIQESILDKLGFNRIFGSYVTGQVRADFLDTDDEDDIATSDRQRLLEDDPRVISLRDFMRQTLLDASEVWTSKRKVKKAKEAEALYPALKTWVEGLPEAQQKPARNLLGLIGGLTLDEARENDRKELFRSGILAFERLRLKQASHQLENLENLDSSQLIPLLVQQDYFEAALYRDIVKSRIEAIRKFRDLTDANEKEKVLQLHLFKNLWLLDTGWDRASESEFMEKKLQVEFPKEFSKTLNDEESKGRVDIKYRTNAGDHIIVELKRYDRVTDVQELEAQAQKYRGCLTKLCKQNGESNPTIYIVFVLGRAVRTDPDAGIDEKYVKDRLALIGARVVFYDTLIQNALAGYKEYLDAQDNSDSIDAIVAQLG